MFSDRVRWCFRLVNDSRIFRASVIRNVVGQVVTRFSMSVSSDVSAVLMVQPHTPTENGRFVDPDAPSGSSK